MAESAYRVAIDGRSAQAGAQQVARSFDDVAAATARTSRAIRQTSDGMQAAVAATQTLHGNVRTLGGGMQDLSLQVGLLNPKLGLFMGVMSRAGAVGAFGAAIGVTAGAVLSLSRGLGVANDNLNLMDTRFQVLGAQSGTLDRLTALSKDLGVSLNEVGGAFARFQLAGKDIGFTSRQTEALTEVVLKLGRIGGATSGELSAGMRQLAQGLASGVLRGDELNSVLENMPPVAREIARELGVSIGQLREMGAEGKLTADLVGRPLITALYRVRREFERMPRTIEQQESAIGTAWTSILSKMDDKLRASSIYRFFLTGLQDGLDEVERRLTNPTASDRLRAVHSQLRVLDPANQNEQTRAQVENFRSRMSPDQRAAADERLRALREEAVALGEMAEREAVHRINMEALAEREAAATRAKLQNEQQTRTALEAAVKPLDDLLRLRGEQYQLEEAITRLRAGGIDALDAYQREVALREQATKAAEDYNKANKKAIVAGTEQIRTAQDYLTVLKERRSAEDALSVERYRAGIQEQIDLQDKLIKAQSEGASAVQQVLDQEKARLEVRKLGLTLAPDEQKALESDIRLLEEKQRILAAEEFVTKTRDEIDYQKRLAEAYGSGERAVYDLNTERQIQLDLQRRGLDVTSKEAASIAEVTRELREQQRETKRTESSWRALTGVFDQAFDRIGSAITEAFVTGRAEAVKFGDVARGVASEMVQWAIKIAALNPLKNWLSGGGTLPTVATIAGGSGIPGFSGGGSGIAGGIGAGIGLLNGLSTGNWLTGSSAIGRAFAGIGDWLGGAELGASFGNAGLAFGSPVGSIGSFGANLLLNSILGDRGVGANVGSLIGSIGGSFFGPFGTIAGSALGNIVGGLFGNSRPSVGPTGIARIPNVIGDSTIQLTSDNGGTPDAADAVAKAIRQGATAAAERYGAYGERACGLDVGGFKSGFNLKEIINNQLANTDLYKDLSAEKAVTEGIRLTLQKAFDGLDKQEVATALQKSASSTIEDLFADLDFANLIGTFASGGIDAVDALNRPLNTAEQAFKDLADAAEKGAEKAEELGISVQDTADYFDAMTDRLKSQVQDDFTSQIRTLQGEGFLNQVQTALDQRSANARTAVAAGLDDNATAGVLFNLSLSSILSDLTRDQLNLVSSTFSDEHLHGVVDTFIAALDDATTVVEDTAPTIADFTTGLQASVQAIDAQTSALESQVSTWNSIGESLRQGRVERALNDATSILSPTSRVKTATDELERIRDLALGGDQSAIQAYDSTANAALEQYFKAFGSNDRRTIELYGQVQADSRRLEGLTVSQVDLLQDQLDELKAIRESLAAQGGDQDFGNRPVRNQILADLTTYTGDFDGQGAFQRYVANQNFPTELLDLISTITSSIGFDTGGSFTVGGVGGIDRNLVPLRLTRGEVVSVSRQDTMADIAVKMDRQLEKMDAVVGGLERIARLTLAGAEMSGEQRERLLAEVAELTVSVKRGPFAA